MVKEVIDFLIQHDPEVGNAVKAEYDRQRRNIELIASENFVSEATLAAASHQQVRRGLSWQALLWRL